MQGMWTALLLILTLMYMKTALIILGIIAAAAFVLFTAYLMHRGWREENEE